MLASGCHLALADLALGILAPLHAGPTLENWCTLHSGISHLAGPSFLAGLAAAIESAQGLDVSLDSETYGVFKLTVVSCMTIGNTLIE